MFQSTPSGGKATARWTDGLNDWCVSIHAFRGEGDRSSACSTVRFWEFQSTPSGGKATSDDPSSNHDIARFNPRLPGGRRRVTIRRSYGLSAVSIHAFRGEGDLVSWDGQPQIAVSIHAFRGEGDGFGQRLDLVPGVSIHAFRGEGDQK